MQNAGLTPRGRVRSGPEFTSAGIARPASRARTDGFGEVWDADFVRMFET
jgi:hypothetical protein